MSGDKILQHGQAFPEVGGDGSLDDFSDLTGDFFLRFGHQTPHAGQLSNLVDVSPGSGLGHHEDRVEAVPVLLHVLMHGLGYLVGHPSPGIDDFIVSFSVGNDSGFVLPFDFLHILLGFLDQLFLLRRD